MRRLEQRLGRRPGRVVCALGATCLLLLGGALFAGCGSSGSPVVPTIPAARTFQLTAFQPDGKVEAKRTTRLSFAIEQPSGDALTAYRRGAGPHTGIHLIIVRSDLGVIIHDHPPVGADGRVSDEVTFPTPGRYRLVVDAYPRLAGIRNFQLFRWIHVAGSHAPEPIPPFRSRVVVDGYTFTIHGRPRLHAIEAAFMKIDVTDPAGHPARFTPWFGALAHAIFFRAGSLDYFHTHVCAPGASGCTSILGGARIAGTSTTPGKLDVGVLLPVAGTWRLFLQCRVNGRVLTAPFTLRVG